MKYSTTGKCWGMAPKAGGGLIEAALPDATKKCERPKSSRERLAGKKGKRTLGGG